MVQQETRDGKSAQLQHAGCIQFSCLAPLVTYFFTPELDLEISVCEKRFQPNFICSGSFFQGPCHNSPTSAITKQVFGFYARATDANDCSSNGDAKRSALVSSAQEWNNCWSLHSVAHLDLHKRNDTPGALSNDQKIVQLTSIIQKCGTVPV